MIKSKLSFYIFLGLIFGIIFGWLCPEIGMKMQPLADIFLKMIKMIIAPLIFSVVVTGIASHGDIKILGKLGLKTFIYFALAAILALLIGLTIGLILEPGKGFPIEENGFIQNSTIEKQSNPNSIINMVMDIVPSNIIQSMSEGNMLQIVVFSIFFALAICAAGEKSKPVLNCISSLSEIMFKLTNLVMNFAPIGIFGAITYTISKNGIECIIHYARIICSLYLALFIFLILILFIAGKIAKIQIISILRAIKEPAVLAFTTASSEAALPEAMKTMENFGVPKNIAGFVMPTGYTFNLDGSTLYLALAMIFSLQIVNIQLSIPEMLFVMIALMVTSKGVAGVPRAALVVLTGTLDNFGYPTIGVTILLGIDHILDMGRTTINLIGNCVAAIVIAKWENQFNYKKMDEFNKQFIKIKKSKNKIIGNELLQNLDIEEYSDFKTIHNDNQ